MTGTDLLELTYMYLLGVNTDSSHAHKMRFWCLSGVPFKISDDYPPSLLYGFIWEPPPPPPPRGLKGTLFPPPPPV